MTRRKSSKKSTKSKTARQAKNSSRKRTAQAKSTYPWTLIAIAGVAVAAAIGLIGLSLRQSGVEVNLEQYASLPSGWVDRNILGNPDASISIEVWEDFL